MQDFLEALYRYPEDLHIYKDTLNSIQEMLIFLDEEIAVRDYIDNNILNYISEVATILINEGFGYGDPLDTTKLFNEIKPDSNQQKNKLNTNFIMHSLWAGYYKKRRDFVKKIAESRKHDSLSSEK